jgi:hypothetical protein
MLGHRSAAAAAITVIVTVAAAAGCGGGKSSPSAAAAQTATTAPSGTPSATPDPAAGGLAVPGIPDPCGLLNPADVFKAAHIPSSAKSGAVASAGGGRSCAYNTGHPNAATISLTAVSKAGFDAFRQLASGGVTDLPGIGQEAYRTSQTPGVVDVFKNGFDINVYVINADSSTQAVADAKALAALVAPKL